MQNIVGLLPASAFALGIDLLSIYESNGAGVNQGNLTAIVS